MSFEINENIDFDVKENVMECGVNIKVIGVGGGGGNMVNHMIKTCNFTSNVDLMVANTDIQDINKSNANTKIQLGVKKTGGRGAGAIPEIGKASAEEAEEVIREKLEGANMLFIAAGLGGGTGTGAAPVIARIAKSMGILVVSAVTIPFGYEGKKRTKVALDGLEELRKESDSVILIQNNKLKTIVAKNAGLSECLAKIDEILVKAVAGIISVLLEQGDSNIDFADINTVMTYRGIALMGVGVASGENAVYDAYKNAVECPLLDNYSSDLSAAKGLIIFFKYGGEIPFMAISDTMDEITEQSSEDTVVIYGYKCSEELSDGEVEVTIIATGFDETKKEEEEKKLELMKREEELRIKQDQGSMQKVSGGYSRPDFKNTNFDEPAFVRRSLD